MYGYDDITDKISYRLKTAEEKKLETSSFIEGIGVANLFYGLEKSILDAVMRIEDISALDMLYYLLYHEGLFVGPSAALNIMASRVSLSPIHLSFSLSYVVYENNE